ncbi:MAG: alpha-amylase family glycosyl hydrolase [Vulcanimicrobiota bacterium]
MIIVQLFNQSFERVRKALPRMKRLGVTHVLISPPQKSHSSRSWWARYQPVDFTRIEGPLGNLSQLRELCWTASSMGLAIVVDTVIHHLSNEGRYLRTRGGRIEAAQYPRFSTPDLRGLHQLGKGRGLPILNTDSPWVRSQLRDYIHGLFGLGVRGFRIDSAKHMDPHLFPYLFDGLPPLLVFGELVYGAPQDFPEAYFQSMRAYDFPLARAIKSAFAPGGDLGSLLNAPALRASHSVPFVNHHDLIKNRSAFDYFRITDVRDRQLAYAYLLARSEGIPLIYGSDLSSREVKAGLNWRRLAGGRPLEWLQASRTTVAARVGPALALAINKGGQPWRWHTRLRSGAYVDLVSGARYWTQGETLEVWIGPRQAALLAPG